MQRAFIFDLEGVIVNSNPVHLEGWARYLEAHGPRPPRAEPLIFARRNDEIVRNLPGQDLSEREIAAHAAAK